MHWFPVLAASAAFLSGCAAQSESTQNAAAPSAIITSASASGLPQANETFSGSVPFLGRSAPLPAGQWTVLVSRGIGVRNVGLVAGVLALVRHDGPLLRDTLIISANVHPAPNGMKLSPICSTSDVLWNDVREAVPFGRQDCTAIGFVRPALWRENQKSIEYTIIKALDGLGVQTPNIMVTLAIQETNGGWFMNEILQTNPDPEGIVPDISTQRGQSAWAAFNLPKDPRKQQYVENLKLVAATLRTAIRQQVTAPAPYVPGSGLTPA